MITNSSHHARPQLANAVGVGAQHVDGLVLLEGGDAVLVEHRADAAAQAVDGRVGLDDVGQHGLEAHGQVVAVVVLPGVVVELLGLGRADERMHECLLEGPQGLAAHHALPDAVQLLLGGAAGGLEEGHLLASGAHRALPEVELPRGGFVRVAEVADALHWDGVGGWRRW